MSRAGGTPAGIEAAAFDALPARAVVIDANGRIAASSRAWRDFVAARGGPEDGLADRPYAEACLTILRLDPEASTRLERERFATTEAGDFRISASPMDGGFRLLLHDERAASAETAVLRDAFEHGNLTEALRESEERFRITFDRAPIGMSLTAPDAKLMRVNQALCDFLGYEERELLALNYLQLTEPGDLATQRSAMRRLRDGEVAMVRMEKRYIRKDGSIAWGDLTTSCVRRADGTPDYYISIIQDIRQRKAVEEALLQREQQLRLIADNVPMVIIYYDHDLRYRFANQTTAAWYGMPLEQIVGRKVADVLPPASFDRLKPYILDALAGRPSRFADKLTYPDGRERQVEFVYSPHLAEDGSVLGAIVVVSDVGERVDMMHALQRRERELRTIAEHFPGLIGYCDSSFTLRFINQTGASWYGRRAEEVIGRPIAAFLPPSHLEPYKRLLEHVLKGNPVRREMSFTYPDGAIRLVELIHMPDRADDAGIRGVFTFVFDLTERRQVEEQLRQVQKIEAVGQLTGGIAHDFNNLLGVIVGNLDLLAQQLNDPRAREWTERAIAAAERGAALTQRLLAFSRRQSLRPQPIDANDLIAESANLLRRTLGEAVSVDTHPATGLWPCMVDAPQLESALLNLAINARDAMPDGGRIGIETANAMIDAEDAAQNRDATPGEYVRITVSDTGIGMTPEVASRAFDPFFTTKPVGRGTGLGLSMVYGFVRQSGGHVRIDTEPGRGTSVSLYLPRAAQARPAVASAADEEAEAAPAGQGQVVLVVEDNPAMLEFALHALETLGYRTAAAGDGNEALRILASRRDIALVFSDIVLPGGTSGIALARALHRQRPELPVLLTSGFSEHGPVQEAQVAMPGLDILSKPYRVRDLGIKLQNLLHGSARRDPA